MDETAQMGYHYTFEEACSDAINLGLVMLASYITMLFFERKNAFKISLLAFPFGFAGVAVFLCLSHAYYWLEVSEVIEVVKKGHPPPETNDNIESLGLSIKNLVNTLPKRKFESLRGNYMFEKKLDGYVSKGATRLDEIFSFFKPKGKTFVDLCAGRGGWSQYMVNQGFKGLAISFWERYPTHEQWMCGDIVSRITGNIREVMVQKVDVVLCEGGESSPNARDEEKNFNELLEAVLLWIRENPKCDFVFKVLTPWSKRTRMLLSYVQRKTGKGRIIRLENSRMTNVEMYFISDGIDRQLETTIFQFLKDHMKSLNSTELYRNNFTSGSEPEWSPVIEEAMDLQPYTYTNAIKEFLNPSESLQKARNLTSFYKEVGWRKTEASGSGSSVRNTFTNELLKGITQHLADFHSWMSTSTTPTSTFKVFMDKVDKPPVEIHDHYEWLRVGYTELAKYLKRQSGPMRRLKPEEFIPTLNRNGTMGFQERNLRWGTKTVSNIGDYIDSGLWKKRLEKAKDSLNEEAPNLIVFNSTGKKEKKMNKLQGKAKGSRLIWYLPATMRIYEAEVFGDIENKLKYLPYSVTGMPLYDYGETLNRIMKNKVAICNDIAGFDTRIAKGQQAICLKYFYKELCEDELYDDVRKFFRIYTNPMVAVEREVKGSTELAFLQGRGQVASGRRPTYAGNTIDNVVVHMMAVAQTQGIEIHQFKDWITRQLPQDKMTIKEIRDRKKGHTDEFGGVFSGDDSALIMSRKNAELFVEKGHHILNDLGWYRKNMEKSEKSEIIHNLSDVDFCSHHYAPIRMNNRFGETITRWLPCRPVDEILAKSSLVIGKPKDLKTEEALARAHGLQLLVNYFHMPEIRAYALSILSATTPGLVLLGLDKGYKIQAQPWLCSGGVLEIVNKCLFGESTNYPADVSIAKLSDLGYMEFRDRARFFMPSNSESKRRAARKAWYISLVDNIHMLRDPMVTYEDWYKEMYILVKLSGETLVV